MVLDLPGQLMLPIIMRIVFGGYYWPESASIVTLRSFVEEVTDGRFVRAR